MQNFLPPPRQLLANLPFLLAKPVAKSPFFMQKLALQALLQRVLKEALTDGDCDFLQNRWLRINIEDIDLSWNYTLDANLNIRVAKSPQADVTIRGSLKSFLFLAAREEDPDTLFFQRDLIIEGDTELGLQVKNLLDSLEQENLPPELQFLLKSGSDYMAIFSPGR